MSDAEHLDENIARLERWREEAPGGTWYREFLTRRLAELKRLRDRP